mgnify:CR=1 FL=1
MPLRPFPLLSFQRAGGPVPVVSHHHHPPPMKITVTLVMPSPVQTSRGPAVFRWTHNPAEHVRPAPRAKSRPVR